jgi:hypothetical protein
MDLFALATLPAAADEAGGPPSIKFYELRDNLGGGGRSGHRLRIIERRSAGRHCLKSPNRTQATSFLSQAVDDL